MELRAHLVPLRVGKYYEQILISFQTQSGDLYPSALTHVDTFWEGRNGENILYKKLESGDVVDVIMRLTEVEK
jgi:hypothetical protein